MRKIPTILIVVLSGLALWIAVYPDRFHALAGKNVPASQNGCCVSDRANESEIEIDKLERLLKDASTPAKLRDCISKTNVGRPLGSLGILKSVVESWFERDPKTALELVAALPSEDLREFALNMARPWYLDDPDSFLATGEKCLSKGVNDNFVRRIFDVLGESDAEEGLRIVGKMGQGSKKQIAIANLFSSWATKRPRDALDAVARLDFPEDLDMAYRGIVSGLSRQGRSSLDFVKEDLLPEKYRMRLGERILEDVSKHDGPDAVFKIFQSDPSMRKYGRLAVRSAVARDWRKFGDGASVCKEVERGFIDLDRDAESIGWAVAGYGNPDKAMALVGELPPEHQSAAARGVVEQIGGFPDYSDNLIDMVASLPPGASKRSVERLLLEKLTSSGESTETARKRLERLMGETK